MSASAVSTTQVKSRARMTRSITQLMDLTGRKALVTGGAGHIGGAVSGALIELGAMVTLLDREASACQQQVEALSRLTKKKASAIALPCDLSCEQATREAIRRAQRQMGGLDILVHCAAFVGTTRMPGWSVPLERQTVEAWDAAIRGNLTSAFVMLH